MFVVGNDYTRDQIHARLGGSKQTYLPTRKGEVVAACLTRELNPRAPQVVLCGIGKRIASAGAVLANQSLPIPVFIKRETNCWQYQGMFRVKESFTDGERFAQFIAGSGRSASDVSRVVVLETFDHAQSSPLNP